MDQTRLNPEHVRVTPEGVRMMTLSRLSEILDAWESLTWPASRADAAAFRDHFGWTPDPRESLLFTSDVVPERSSSFIVYTPFDGVACLRFYLAAHLDPHNTSQFDDTLSFYLNYIIKHLGERLQNRTGSRESGIRLFTSDNLYYRIGDGGEKITLSLNSPSETGNLLDFLDRKARGELEDWERE